MQGENPEGLGKITMVFENEEALPLSPGNDFILFPVPGCPGSLSRPMDRSITPG